MKFLSNVRLIGGLSLIAALILFVALNLTEIEVRLLVATVKMPIAFVVFFSAGMGAGALWLLRMVRRKDAAPR